MLYSRIHQPVGDDVIHSVVNTGVNDEPNAGQNASH